MSDAAFDDVYPFAIQQQSAVHWTPVRVCRRIVELLDLREGETLLDVGSGAGKFCIVAAAMTPARVQGIERRRELVDVAREAIQRLGSAATIIEGDLKPEHALTADAIYLFNPFMVPILLPGAVQGGVHSVMGRIADDIAIAEALLAATRPGTRVVTYCGFGGAVPSGFTRAALETWVGGAMELWKR